MNKKCMGLIGFSITHFINIFDRYSTRYRNVTLRAHFLEDAEPVVIVIDYNVIALWQQFCYLEYSRAIHIDRNDSERLLGHLLSPYISFYYSTAFVF